MAATTDHERLSRLHKELEDATREIESLKQDIRDLQVSTSKNADKLKQDLKKQLNEKTRDRKDISQAIARINFEIQERHRVAEERFRLKRRHFHLSDDKFEEMYALITERTETDQQIAKDLVEKKRLLNKIRFGKPRPDDNFELKYIQTRLSENKEKVEKISSDLVAYNMISKQYYSSFADLED